MEKLRNINQFPFEFCGEFFTSVLASDRKLYISVHDMCQSLGVQTNGQLKPIRSQAAIVDALVELEVTRAYGDEAEQTQGMFCLRLDWLPFWLGTLQPNRIQDEVKREHVVQFQREFADLALPAIFEQPSQKRML